eukprot:GHRQ01004440.1.p1 GENE.GHRQ01004440.1~~GHRQ01004440.1.p1  ORF type:complete len:256 (+),score=35.56 GHRQ01004440.1:454-1221(+)
MPLRWFVGPGGERFQFWFGSEGINVSKLAEKLHLKEPLELNGVVLGTSGCILLADADSFLHGLGDTAERAIRVTGEPAAGPGAAASSAGDKLLAKLDEMDAVLAEQRQLGQQVLDGQEELRQQVLGEQSVIRELLLDQFKPVSSSASTKKLEQYRHQALDFYGGPGASQSETVVCMVTGEECSKSSVTAGHIYRQGWPRTLLVGIAGRVCAMLVFVVCHDPVAACMRMRQAWPFKAVDIAVAWLTQGKPCTFQLA